ncbi:uncharacterized protein EKO05_0001874 [Ascochyta rabiei]|uniref:uncharacterized protein n=1 Tax=Didymella rabiei TaxID=5454 RepID=UPI00220EB0CB|nr:uncharacterized protein EKO05_0001874 [Ascochyta rabiei]UPX11260.1 hypothetical protein EKO05_0001874 [Ascochyta rabiei]
MDLGLDETLKLCKQIFAGDTIEYSKRTPEYQAKMETLIRQGIDAAPDHIIRSRRELVQHTAAFHYIIRRFIHEKAPLIEELMRETHEILVAGTGAGSAGSAGFLSNKEHGGLYRTGNVFIGSQKAPPANKVAESMASLVRKLEADLAEAEEEKKLDPFALAAKYCSMLVYIHPFQDANGRICRLILNAILIRYAGIVASLGEHDQSRDEYTETATESRAVGGHHGALGTMVLQEAKNSLKRMKDRLSKIKKKRSRKHLAEAYEIGFLHVTTTGQRLRPRSVTCFRDFLGASSVSSAQALIPTAPHN